MEKAFRTGKMAPNMKEIGEMEWRKAKVYFIMLMVTFTVVNSTKIVLMDLVSMYIKMGRNIKDSGRMICKMDRVRKSLKMARNMTVCLRTARNGGRGRINGRTSLCIRAIGLRIILKDMASINGQTAEFTKENGKKISSMEEASIHGLTAEGMKVNMKTTRNMATVSIHGQTVRNMMANG